MAFDMSFFSFLNEPANYVDAPSSAGSYGGSAGVPDTWSMPSTPSTALPEPSKGVGGSGMTWGQILQSLMSISGPYPSHSGQMSGGVQRWQQPMQGQPRIYQIGPTADYNKPEQKSSTGVGDVMAIAGMF